MRRTFILAAFAVVVAATTAGGAHAKNPPAYSEPMLLCLLLELAEEGACRAQHPSMISGYLAVPSTNPREALDGRKARRVVQSMSR